MKKIIYLIVCLVLAYPAIAGAQESTDKSKPVKNSLSSENLDKESKDLDAQIQILNNNIAGIIKKYNLMSNKDIKILPYQTTYELDKDSIEMEKHVFIKSDLIPTNIIGVRKKKIKIYTNGQTITKIESEVYEKTFDTGSTDIVRVSDGSPDAASKDEITFTHIVNKKTVMDKKKLAEVKNTLASPIKNEIKREFIIPHLSFFYNSLLFVAESYSRSMKDNDAQMIEFLKHSNDY